MNPNSGCSSTDSILIVGASCRAAAQCARRAGFEVSAIDLFGDRDLIESAQTQTMHDFHRSAHLAEHTGARNLLLAGGIENYPEVVDTIVENAERSGTKLLCAADASILRSMRDPRNWMRWANAAGIKWPKTLFDERDRQEWMVTNGPIDSSHWLRKRYAGAGGLGVMRTSLDEPMDTSSYLQEFRLGAQVGALFLSAADGARLLSGVGSWGAENDRTASEFLYRGSFGPLPIEPGDADKLVRFANEVQTETGVLGLWQADFVLDHGQWYLLEINPRWTASMELIDRLFDVHLVAMHFETIRDPRTLGAYTQQALEQLVVHKPRVSGKQIVYAPHRFRPTQELLDHWWAHRLDWNLSFEDQRIDETGGWYADIPATDHEIEQGYPVISCIATALTLSELKQRLEFMANHLIAEMERQFGR